MSSNTPIDGRTTLGMSVHLLGFVLGLFGPLIVYLVASNNFTKANARNALNWQLFVLAASLILIVVFFVVTHDVVGLITGGLLLCLLFMNFVFPLWATIKALRSEAWQYPLAPNFL